MRRLLILSACLVLVAQGGMAAFRSTKPALAPPREIGQCVRPEAPALGFHPPVTGTIPGALILSGGSWLVAGAHVGGAVIVMPGTYAAICNSTIKGAVLGDHTAGIEICSSTVGGGIAVNRSMGPVLIGDNGDENYSGGPGGGKGFCSGNLLTGQGAISLSGNTGPTIEVAKNTVGGGVTLINNHISNLLGDDIVAEYTPEVEGNTIAGSLSCTGNTPPPSDDATPNTVTGARTGQCSAPGF